MDGGCAGRVVGDLDGRGVRVVERRRVGDDGGGRVVERLLGIERLVERQRLVGQRRLLER
jgi:hypothetical protein